MKQGTQTEWKVQDIENNLTRLNRAVVSLGTLD